MWQCTFCSRVVQNADVERYTSGAVSHYKHIVRISGSTFTHFRECGPVIETEEKLKIGELNQIYKTMKRLEIV